MCGKPRDKKKLAEDFIRKSRELYGDKFNYERMDYVNSWTPIKLICNDCRNSFDQLPHNNLVGKSCPYCAGNKHKNTEEFIEKSRQIYGDLFDYSKSVYKNAKEKVEIICKKHNISFWQRPDNHYCGNGCPECKNNVKHDTERFLKDAIGVHGIWFDYSRSVYVNCHTKLEIGCPIHGFFWQEPRAHIYEKQGCEKCSRSVSKVETRWLDELYISNDCRQFPIKIGKKIYKVDGFDPQTNTIYEFLGDFWHGNPELYDKNRINKAVNKKFGALYKKTMNRLNLFEKNGYKVLYIWESDFRLKEKDKIK